MFSVALIGADGAGKTTVGRRLIERDALPLGYIYMGSNPEANTHSLPTTRLLVWIKHKTGRSRDQGGPPDPARARRRASGRGALRRRIKAPFRLLYQLSEEWYRLFIAWRLHRSGRIVLFDRHFFPDFFAHDIESKERLPLDRRIHGTILRRFYPRPNLIVLLDAPAEVLFERKGEGTVELLEQRRQEYFRLEGEVDHFEVVDATMPLERVVGAIESQIEAHLSHEQRAAYSLL